MRDALPNLVGRKKINENHFNKETELKKVKKTAE
jgi:hypothetical protein